MITRAAFVYDEALDEWVAISGPPGQQGPPGSTPDLTPYALKGQTWASWTGTQAEYDAIPVKDPGTMYVVVAP